MRRKYREAEAAFNTAGYGDLATYNSEVARGIVHTAEWDAKMVEVKQRFDAEQYAQAEREGWVIIG